MGTASGAGEGHCSIPQGKPQLSDQVQDSRAYRLLPDGAQMVLMQRDYNIEWNPQYRFTLNACEYEDFAEMCRFHQTSPQSHFTQRRICSLATETGRITLSDMH